MRENDTRDCQSFIQTSLPIGGPTAFQGVAVHIPTRWTRLQNYDSGGKTYAVIQGLPNGESHVNILNQPTNIIGYYDINFKINIHAEVCPTCAFTP